MDQPINIKPLEDKDRMPFGKYRNTVMQDVPVNYLHWFYCNVTPIPGKDTERVLDYITRSLDALKLENTDLIWKRP
jgi:uncharacterized protein (DUF3820 family)